MKISKKLKKNHFNHVEFIVSLLLVATLAVFGGRYFFKSHAAGGWTVLNVAGLPQGASILACKTYYPSYGGLWKLTFQYYKPTSYSAYYGLYVKDNTKNNTVFNQQTNSWLWGTFGSYTSPYLSIWDNYIIQPWLSAGSWLGTNWMINNLANC